MSIYMVERSLKGIAMNALAAARKATIATSHRFRDEGTPVRYVRSTFVPTAVRACACSRPAAPTR